MRFHVMTVFFLLAGCGGADANVAGNYALAVTSGDSTCPIAGWRKDNMSVGTPLTIMQNGSDVTAQVGGGGGAMFNTLLGSNTLSGTVSGDELSLTLHGTRSFTQRTCSYTYNATVQARLGADLLTGSITFVALTNGTADCLTITNCHAQQTFNGTRPPSH